MKKNNTIDYKLENLAVRKFDAKKAIQAYYLETFPHFLRGPLEFFLKWQVILLLTIIGPLGASLMRGDYPKTGFILLMLMMLEHHSYFFEFCFIIMFYYSTKKQRQKTNEMLETIGKLYCLDEKNVKICNRQVLLKIGFLGFFLGSCGWSIAGIYLPVLFEWINTGVLIIPPIRP